MNNIIYKSIQDFKKLCIENKDTKIEFVLTSTYGGFSFNEQLSKILGVSFDGLFGDSSQYENNRSNPKLIKAIRELGDNYTGDLEIITIDIDEIFYTYIEDNDGYEILIYSPTEGAKPILEIL